MVGVQRGVLALVDRLIAVPAYVRVYIITSFSSATLSFRNTFGGGRWLLRGSRLWFYGGTHVC